MTALTIQTPPQAPETSLEVVNKMLMTVIESKSIAAAKAANDAVFTQIIPWATANGSPLPIAKRFMHWNSMVAKIVTSLASANQAVIKKFPVFEQVLLIHLKQIQMEKLPEWIIKAKADGGDHKTPLKYAKAYLAAEASRLRSLGDDGLVEIGRRLL